MALISYIYRIFFFFNNYHYTIFWVQFQFQSLCSLSFFSGLSECNVSSHAMTHLSCLGGKGWKCSRFLLKTPPCISLYGMISRQRTFRLYANIQRRMQPVFPGSSLIGHEMEFGCVSVDCFSRRGWLWLFVRSFAFRQLFFNASGPSCTECPVAPLLINR